MNSPNQHIPINQIDPGKNVGDGEGSVQVHLEEDLMQVNAKVCYLWQGRHRQKYDVLESFRCVL